MVDKTAPKTPLIGRALISVSDKRGIVDLARQLSAQGIELLSTGGTSKTIAKAGIPVIDVADYTGFPEIMDGRVKTLHPLVHGGILARRDKDQAVMREHHIKPIDIVVVNLYPFERATADPTCSFDAGVEHMDIGGVTLIRAAAKNHTSVLVAVDPDDYTDVLEAVRNDPICPTLRKRLAQKAFAHTAAYDSAISNWLTAGTQKEQTVFPEHLVLSMHRHDILRYGENPHQRAAFYRMPQSPSASISTSLQLHGRKLSFNNLADADAAWECVNAFTQPACVIVKHANPCGVALGKTLMDAYENAYATDPTSAFGGIIAFNQKVHAPLMNAILDKQFVEVLIAPEYDDESKSVMKKKPALRVLETGGLCDIKAQTLHYKQIIGGMLVEEYDSAELPTASIKVVSKHQPKQSELDDLLFAWKVARCVKSNAIVYAKDQRTSGIGAGQMNRVMSARIAALNAQQHKRPLKSAVMASDAFFPFRDSIDTAASYGISAVIQPGGSKRDAETIAAADEHSMAMVFTGMRHFRH